MVFSLRITITAVIFCLALFFQTTFAQVGFGGRVIAPLGLCATTPGLVYSVFDFAQKRPLVILFPPSAAIPIFSLKFAFIFPPYPGMQILGKYVPLPGPCAGIGVPGYEGFVTQYGSSFF